MASRTINSKRNIIIGILSSLIVPILGFFVRTALSIYLGEQYLGLTSLFTSIVQVLNLAELGFSSAVVVSLYKPVSEKDITTIRAIMAFYRYAYRIIGVVIAIGGLIIIPFLPLIIGDETAISDNTTLVYLFYLFNTVISYFLFSYKEALLNAVQRFDIVKSCYIIISIFRSAFQLLILSLYKNFYLYVFLLCVGTIVYNISLHIISKRLFPEYYPSGKVSKEIKHGISQQIAGLSIGKLLDVARNSLDSIIISLYLGLTMVAIYNNYFYIYNMIISIMWIIISAIQAGVGNSVVVDSVEKNYADIIKFEYIYNIIIVFATVCLLCLYQPFMCLWMGEHMLLNELNMILFVLYFYIMAITGIRNAYFNALGLWWKARWIVVAESALNLILNFFLGKVWGITGILVATIITMVFINYIGITNLVFKEYFKRGLLSFYKERMYYALITIVVCICAYLACGYVSEVGITGIVLRLIISVIMTSLLLPLLLFISNKSLFIEAVNYIKLIIRIR